MCKKRTLTHKIVSSPSVQLWYCHVARLWLGNARGGGANPDDGRAEFLVCDCLKTKTFQLMAFWCFAGCALPGFSYGYVFSSWREHASPQRLTFLHRRRDVSSSAYKGTTFVSHSFFFRNPRGFPCLSGTARRETNAKNAFQDVRRTTLFHPIQPSSSPKEFAARSPEEHIFAI